MARRRFASSGLCHSAVRCYSVKDSTLALITRKRFISSLLTIRRSAAHSSLSLPGNLVAFARNVDGDLLVLDSGAVKEWSSAAGVGMSSSSPPASTVALNSLPPFARTGRVVAPSLWILLERLRDNILAGKCEMLDDCFVEAS